MSSCYKVTYQRRIIRYLCFISIVLIAAAPTVRAQSSSSEAPADLYKTNCVMCHGDDGAGTPFGNRVHVMDLRSKEVQEMSPADLAKTISDGKEQMPAFKGRFTEDQIQQLVDYIRHKFAKKDK